MTGSNRLLDSRRHARTTAHLDAVQIGPEDLLERLARVLGRHVLAVIAGRDVRTVQRWLAGGLLSAPDERRLRDAYQVYLLLAAVEGDHTIRAWFVGMNPQLDDEAPAEVLGEGQSRNVMAAARAFVNGG